MPVQQLNLEIVNAISGFIKNRYSIEDEAIHLIASQLTFKRVRKGKHLLSPGQICEHLYFIQKGMIRSFIKEGGKEITTWIDMEGEVSTSIRGYCYRHPSYEYLQTLEDCELIILTYSDLDMLLNKYIELNVVVRKFLEECYAGAEERAFISRIPNAGKRYKHLLKTRPEMINRIPLKYIASYLGITMETLSRIRTNMARKAVALKED